jgi:uncharacterized cupredoxin-like copper-binding protein
MQRLILPTLLMLALTSPVMAAGPRVIEVILDSYSITPDRIVVNVNEPVTLKVTNKATLTPHDLIIKAPEAGIDVAVDLHAGKSGEATFTPTRAGTYEILCNKKLLFFKSHKDKGMHGVLVVE